MPLSIDSRQFTAASFADSILLIFTLFVTTDLRQVTVPSAMPLIYSFDRYGRVDLKPKGTT